MDKFFFPGLALAVGSWIYWYAALHKVRSFHSNSTLKRLLRLTPPLCMLILLAVLLRWSSSDVRSDAGEISFYMIFGAIWLRLGLLLVSLLGIAVREDVLERKNRAAAWAVCGAMVGTMLCFAGANIGSGPGPEVVLLCAFLSTTAFFGLWFCLERSLGLADRITIERDEGAAVRVGGWMIGLGLILGGAVAGNWESYEATLRDFAHYGWAAVLFMLPAIHIERYLSSQPARRDLQLNSSFGVAATYILAAGAYVLWLGVR